LIGFKKLVPQWKIRRDAYARWLSDTKQQEIDSKMLAADLRDWNSSLRKVKRDLRLNAVALKVGIIHRRL
jgi:hypothetical protein